MALTHRWPKRLSLVGRFHRLVAIIGVSILIYQYICVMWFDHNGNETKQRATKALYETPSPIPTVRTTPLPIVRTTTVAQGDMKTIMWFDHNGNETKQKALLQSLSMDFSTCQYRNCKITFETPGDRDEFTLYNKPMDADAVLVRGTDVTRYKIPPPRRRDSDQVFVLIEKEAPPVKPKKISGWLDVFNWTMTWRLDSDIPYLYGYIVPTDKNSLPEERNYEEIFDNKTKTALWYVSHCKTRSRREDYVSLLKLYTDVDSFGDCTGKYACRKTVRRRSKCENDIMKDYKFYLSFENSFATDYVTEKLFHWYKSDIIPVVRGGGKYSEIVPLDTVISTNTFAHPKDLAKFMNELGTNKERYIGYLKRKKNYTVKTDGLQRAYCKLCEMLHNVNDHRRQYKNITEWFHDEGYRDFSHSEDWIHY